jgi:hypothetical protein
MVFLAIFPGSREQMLIFAHRLKRRRHAAVCQQPKGNAMTDEIVAGEEPVAGNGEVANGDPFAERY